MINAESVTVFDVPGGVKIVVDDPATDSLAVIEVKSRNSSLSARLGLRGNYSAYWRPMRWVSTTMEALPVSVEKLARRKAAAQERTERGAAASTRSARILRGEIER